MRRKMEGQNEEGMHLFQQFLGILDYDPLIDEVGFLPPSQLQTLDPIDATKESSPDYPEFNKRYFWFKDHKLAISSQILSKLYRAAVRAHSEVRSSCEKYTEFDGFDRNDLMTLSMALLILSPDFTTAWNSRKLVLSRNVYLQLLLGELLFSNLILSYSPKCENAWSHRRWAIKMVAEHFQDLKGVIKKESELVKKIAERSKMNYRAWKHRFWLIHYMTTEQVLLELNSTTKWAELHVADNCCFHFRRCLLLRLLEDTRELREPSCNSMSHVHSLWKDELRWDGVLLKRYKGREALWSHRRFLAVCWIKHFLNDEKQSCSTDDHFQGPSLLELFLAEELQLLSDCLQAPADEFEDAHVQAQLAASYIMWISKQVPIAVSRIDERLHSTGNLRELLTRTCPEKILIWNTLLGGVGLYRSSHLNQTFVGLTISSLVTLEVCNEMKSDIFSVLCFA